MNPSASSCCRYKINELEALVEDHKSSGNLVVFAAITETWLQPHISDAQIRLDGYSVSRCDRRGRGGGVCLYTHDSYAIASETKYDDGVCQCLVTVMPLSKWCNIIVYRPPDAGASIFQALSRFIIETLHQNADDSYRVCLMGDLNFPCIDWKLFSIQTGYPSTMTISARELLKIMSQTMMNQYIHCPTRGRNTLDIFCTNDPFLISKVETTHLPISDHELVTLSLTSCGSENYMHHERKEKLSGFESINFARANFSMISQKIADVDWIGLRNSCHYEKFPQEFTDTLLSICKEFAPLKKPRTGRPKKMNALRRKKKRIEKKISASHPSSKEKLERELAQIYYQIKEEYNSRKNTEELNMIKQIKTNPKKFYGYAKSHSQMRHDIVMMTNEQGEVVRDPYAISNVLQNQFSSVYSDPSSDEKKSPEISMRADSIMPSEDFKITEEDIVRACQELKSNSSPGPDGVPAKLLIECRAALSTPLAILWNESFARGIVPNYYKQSIVCPIYKKRG